MSYRGLCAVILAAGTAAMMSAVPVSAASAMGVGTWRTVPLPASVQNPALLDSVTATSPFNAWAVGSDAMTGQTAGQPMILRWNGRMWAKVALPAVTWSGVLKSVSASSFLDAWAAGRDTTGLSHVLHWNGFAWRPVRFPGDTDTSFAISAIAVGPAGAAWLVGTRNPNSPVIERWDGIAWRVVAAPFATGSLNGVRITRSGVWITGAELTSASENGIAGVILHRQGAGWSVITTIGVTNTFVEGLDDVLPVSPDDIWTVGWVPSTVAPGLTLVRPWIGHWNGTAWDSSLLVPAEPFGQNDTITPDRTGRPQWIGAQTSVNPANTLYAHFDGSTWTPVSGSALSGVFLASTFTAHIPWTNATWGVTVTAADTANGILPKAPLIELNKG